MFPPNSSQGRSEVRTQAISQPWVSALGGLWCSSLAVWGPCFQEFIRMTQTLQNCPMYLGQQNGWVNPVRSLGWSASKPVYRRPPWARRYQMQKITSCLARAGSFSAFTGGRSPTREKLTNIRRPIPKSVSLPSPFPFSLSISSFLNLHPCKENPRCPGKMTSLHSTNAVTVRGKPSILGQLPGPGMFSLLKDLQSTGHWCSLPIL